MKENRFLILGILAMVGAAVVLCIAFLMPGNQADAEPADTRIAVIVPQSNTEYWQQVIRGIENEIDADVSIQITQVPQTDTEEQRKRFEMAVAADVDGMIVQMSDDAAVAEMITKADAAGIPVVLVDSDAADSGRQYYVGSDNYQAGYMAAERLYEATGGRASIAVISGLENQGSQKARLEGFTDALRQWPGMEIVCVEYSNMDSVQAAQTTQTLLKAYPEINAFVGTSTADIEGIIKTMESKLNRNSYHLIGFDDSTVTVDGIRKGFVLATVVQDPYEMGRQAAQLLTRAMAGTAQEELVLTDIFLLTKDRLQEYGQWIQERRYE